MTRKSAAQLADELAGLGQEIYRRAGEEVRAEVAREIEDRYLGPARCGPQHLRWRQPGQLRTRGTGR